MNDPIHVYIAAQINRRRRRRRLGQGHLADAAGVSRAQMSRLISLQTSPTIGLLAKIAGALGVGIRELLPPGRR